MTGAAITWPIGPQRRILPNSRLFSPKNSTISEFAKLKAGDDRSSPINTTKINIINMFVISLGLFSRTKTSSLFFCNCLGIFLDLCCWKSFRNWWFPWDISCLELYLSSSNNFLKLFKFVFVRSSRCFSTSFSLSRFKGERPMISFSCWYLLAMSASKALTLVSRL